MGIMSKQKIIADWLGRSFCLELVKLWIWKDPYYLNLTSYEVLDISSIVEVVKKIFGLWKDLDVGC
jgi:hypothetical protein